MQAFPAETHTARLPDGLVAALRPLDTEAPTIEAWRSLAKRMLVENLFYEPAFGLAARGAFGSGVNLLTIGDRPPEEAGARLIALWPCRIVHRWGVPLPALMGWMHGFSVLGVPLLDREAPAKALVALLDAPHRLGLPRRLLMPYLPLDGPFAELMKQALAETGSRRADFWTHARGSLDLVGREADVRAAYLEDRLSGRRAHQLDRFRRRLERSGPVSFETVREPGDLSAALDDYVALERAGWKGRGGTSADQRPGEVAFLGRLVEAYGATGRARIDRLRRDGRSLAVSLGFETDTTFWYLKIAYAEAEARNSPGAQLVRHVTQNLLDDPRLAAADSCAPPGFGLIETFWAERRALAHVLVEAGGRDSLFSLAVRLERLRAFAVRARQRRAAR